jgi:hypothetical protein
MNTWLYMCMSIRFSVWIYMCIYELSCVFVYKVFQKASENIIFVWCHCSEEIRIDRRFLNFKYSEIGLRSTVPRPCAPAPIFKQYRHPIQQHPAINCFSGSRWLEWAQPFYPPDHNIICQNFLTYRQEPEINNSMQLSG